MATDFAEATGQGPGRNADFIALHARSRPAFPALVDAESRRSLTYAELDRAIASAVTVLVGLGATEGSRVATLSRNRPEILILHFACARMGAILVPLNWRLSRVELEAILLDCAPDVLVSDGVAAAEAPSGCVALDLETLSSLFREAAPAPSGFSDPDLPSLMLYTSGTSGRPKGVMLSERNLLATAVNFTVLGQVTANSVFLADAPMFHVIGLVTNFRPALLMGATVVVSPGFDPATTLERLADEQLSISHYFCVPQMADMLRATPAYDPKRLGSLAAIFTGGAPHPAVSIRQWLDDGITIADGYGMTEAGTVLGMPLDRDVIARKAGSAGLMPPTIRHRIVDEEDRPCAPGEVGELLLSGDNITSGYWNRREETAKAFTDDGFFRTGDLVRSDGEGFFYLVDRKKDMFISGGENVYPAEVEAALREHPDIVEACVVGMPDAQWGEVGHAVLVLRPGASMDEKAIRAHCEQRLARYKLPKKILALDQLTRTGSGKVVKSELKKRLLEES